MYTKVKLRGDDRKGDGDSGANSYSHVSLGRCVDGVERTSKTDAQMVSIQTKSAVRPLNDPVSSILEYLAKKKRWKQKSRDKLPKNRKLV